MLHTSHRIRFGSFIVVVVASALVAAGCGGSVSPTAPSIPEPGSGSGAFGSESSSVISGQVVGGGEFSGSALLGGAPRSSVAAGVQVSINGTNISTITDGSGNFLLIGIPNGTVVLHFSGGGINADLVLQGIGSNQLIQITVQVQSASAQVVQETRHEIDEFEGRLDSVDASMSSFTLEDSTTFLTDTNTWWDTGGDIRSFGELIAAYGRGVSVEMEGRYVLTPEGLLLATAVKAETDDDDDVSFEGFVSAVDRLSLTITLVDGAVIVVDSTTQWRAEGDYLSFEFFADAFEAGVFIEVEAEGSLQADGKLFAAKIKAKADELELEIKPDEWDVSWVGSGSSGSGGSGVEARIEDGPFAQILPSSVVMVGPDGITTIMPVATEFKSKRFEATFTKAAAIGIVGSAAPGDVVTITVSGMLTDGTPWELTDVIVVVDEDDDDDDKNKVDPVVAAQAIADIGDVIDELNRLVAAGEMDANDAKPLITKLESAIASLEKLNGNPAVNQLEAFLNALESAEKTGKISENDAEFIEGMVEAIIDLLEGDD